MTYILSLPTSLPFYDALLGRSKALLAFLLRSFAVHCVNIMATEYTSLFGSAPLAQTPSISTSQITTPSTSTSQIATPPTTPPPSNIPFEKYVVDVNGDLYLEIGEAQYLNGGPCKRPMEFRVDSKALARASPVFMKMLYGSFAESKKPDEPGDRKWTIKLPDDNSLDMSTLIYIMHCKFDLVPLAMTIDGLYGIAVLTDKYDCTALVRPWIRSWLDTSGAHVSNTSLGNIRRVSWIAWEYGDQSLFEKVAKELIVHSVNSFPVIFNTSLEPNGLQGTYSQENMRIKIAKLTISDRFGGVTAPGSS